MVRRGQPGRDQPESDDIANMGSGKAGGCTPAPLGLAILDSGGGGSSDGWHSDLLEPAERRHRIKGLVIGPAPGAMPPT
ncbi:MAG: hypothetical protein ACLVJH_07280 [Faecalibacterium prausnitzii]